jgi:hypothetical protein
MNLKRIRKKAKNKEPKIKRKMKKKKRRILIQMKKVHLKRC